MDPIQQPGQNVSPPPQPHKTHWVALILISVISLLIAGIAIYFLTQTPKPEPQVLKTAPTPTPDPTANWKTYTNKTYAYSFKYPQDWNLDASRAEPATANNPPASPNTSWVSLSKDGYTFTFDYNVSGIGGVESIAARSEEITIDNRKFLKSYVDNKANPPCFPSPVLGIDPQTGKLLQPKQECYQYFDQIFIDDLSIPKGIASGIVTINGKTSGIGFELPTLTMLDDPTFVKYNTIFNQILYTFQFLN